MCVHLERHSQPRLQRCPSELRDPGGDLDECNGMVHYGVYGYYVTDSYPDPFRQEPLGRGTQPCSKGFECVVEFFT